MPHLAVYRASSHLWDSLGVDYARQTIACPIQFREEVQVSTRCGVLRRFPLIETVLSNTTEGFSFIETEALKRTSIGPVILKASWKKKQSTEGQDRVNTL